MWYNVLVEKVIYPTFWVFCYKEVPREIVFYFRILSYKLLDYFSVQIILNTFFEPWKRDIVYIRNAPLNVRIYGAILNLVSRFVGATLRTFILLIYTISFLIGMLAFTFVMIFWLFFIIIVILLLIFGFYYLTQGGISGI